MRLMMEMVKVTFIGICLVTVKYTTATNITSSIAEIQILNNGSTFHLKSMKNEMILSWLSITEKTATGNKISSPDRQGQRIDTLNQVFQISPVQERKQSTNVTGSKFANLKLVRASADIQLGNDAKITSLLSVVALMTSSGIIPDVQGNYNVSAGSMGLFLEITDWPFCGKDGIVCMDNKNQTIKGEYLDVIISVSSSQSPVQNGAVFYFGSSSLSFAKDIMLTSKPCPPGSGTNSSSSNCTVNPTISSVPLQPDYPKLQEVDGKSQIALRFPKFNTTSQRLFYGPIIAHLREEVTTTAKATKTAVATGTTQMAKVTTKKEKTKQMKPNTTTKPVDGKNGSQRKTITMEIMFIILMLSVLLI